MKKVALSFGETLIDFHKAALDCASGLPTFVAHSGGAPANVAVTIAKLGARSAFVGMLSTDFFGDLLWAQMSEAGVDLSYVLRTKRAKTALAFVDHNSIGERNFTFYRLNSADLLFRARHFQAKAFTTAAVFHACSNSLAEFQIAKATLSGMSRARMGGTLVSFDMNLRPALWGAHGDPMPRILDALAMADLVKLSAEEFRFASSAMGDERAFFRLLWQHPTCLLVVTDGPRPIRWFTREGHGVLPVIPITPVDPTGAGDAFMGGLLYRLVSAGISAHELRVLAGHAAHRDDLLSFAGACGTAAAMRTGSFSSMPSLKTVQSLLATCNWL